MTSNPQSAAPFVPPRAGINQLRAASAGCRGCALWEHATQTIFGEGPSSARVVMVGEQPGDVEDQRGRPFVGPAGRLLDQALEAARIDRSTVYVTNAVKHFKWQARGKRRIHSKPDAAEVAACSPWLEAELATIKPLAVVCLGATAAQALLGRSFRVTRQHGELMPHDVANYILATIHPSAVLRAPDDAARAEAFDGVVRDLHPIAKLLDSQEHRSPDAERAAS